MISIITLIKMLALNEKSERGLCDLGRTKVATYLGLTARLYPNGETSGWIARFIDSSCSKCLSPDGMSTSCLPTVTLFPLSGLDNLQMHVTLKRWPV